MSKRGTNKPYSMPEFLAHAIAMEQEAADRYHELADMMEAYNNLEVSKLFRDMTRYSELHRDSIKERAGVIELPQLRSWQYRWVTPPEVGDEYGFDYTLHPYDALRYARTNELQAMRFYQKVARTAEDEEMKALATEFAEEEEEHAAAINQLLDMTLRP